MIHCKPSSRLYSKHFQKDNVQTNPVRCAWATNQPPFYQAYHDSEWGVPVHNDQRLFEMLILEGAQAGLSWQTILKRREGYRHAFHQFDVGKVANMLDAELEAQMLNADIIRNRLKIFCTRRNAIAFMRIQQEFGSFDAYAWPFVGGKPKHMQRQPQQALPATTADSDAFSKDLKKRGMTFVGSTILYAYMQAVGMVNDHSIDCFCYREE